MTTLLWLARPPQSRRYRALNLLLCAVAFAAGGVLRGVL